MAGQAGLSDAGELANQHARLRTIISRADQSAPSDARSLPRPSELVGLVAGAGYPVASNNAAPSVDATADVLGGSVNGVHLFGSLWYIVTDRVVRFAS